MSTTPHDSPRDDLLVDYLYDELDADARVAFERSLEGRPDLAEEVAAHQRTRRLFAGLPQVSAPADLLDAVMGEAQALAAAAEPPRRPWPVRLFEVFTRPAFAAAVVAVVVLGVGLVYMNKGSTVGGVEGSQRLAPSLSRGAAPPAASAKAKADSASELGGAAAEPEVVGAVVGEGGAEPAPKAAAAQGPGEPEALADEAAAAPAPADEAAAIGGVSAQRPAQRAVMGLVDDAAKDVEVRPARGPTAGPRAGRAERPSGAAASKTKRTPPSTVTPAKKRAPKGAASRPGRGAGGPAPAEPAPVSAKSGSASGPAPARAWPKAPSGGPGRADQARANQARANHARGRASDDSDEGVERGAATSRPASARRSSAALVSGGAPAPAQVDEAADKQSGEREGPAPGQAEQVATLWKRYAGYLAAGRWSEAQQTLDTLGGFPGEAERVRKARGDLATRRAAREVVDKPAAKGKPARPGVDREQNDERKSE